MNDLEQVREPVDPTLLDRLVDGELPEPQRRDLLSTLDGRPEGWRQCALAFLEAQSWCESLGQATSESAQRPATGGPGLVVPKTDESAGRVAVQLAPVSVGVEALEPASSPRHTGTWTRTRSLAMAASFLVTLTAGMILQRVWHDQNVGSALGPAGMRAVRLTVDGQSMEVPLVEGSRLEEVLQAEHNRMEQMYQQMEEMQRTIRDLRQQRRPSYDAP